MKFELSIALKYLTPKWRQLSVSIISLISILVIALVVWLIVVFFSVTQGLEKSWVQKLVALSAPIRVYPTEAYYKSYYYLVDGVSINSDYTRKSIGDKLSTASSNPYDPDFDEELPLHWSSPDLDNSGNLKDLVKCAVSTINGLEGIPGIAAKEYEQTIANLRLQLIRADGSPVSLAGDIDTDPTQSYISQAMYIGSYDADNPSLPKSMLPVDEPQVGSDTQAVGSALPETLPRDETLGDAILLPKGFREGGVLIGDGGYISYNAPTASAVQEQRVPIYVAGFYDPGIFPLGSKVLLANRSIPAMIRAAYPSEESALSNGLNVYLNDLDDAEQAKAKITAAFEDAGIAQYWNVETYREFEFTKDLLQQLRSERNVFTLISAVIIIVACSNIISMLIILVNDKKMEIGILRSMGASSRSIATIFGFCGVFMGVLGSLFGTVIAVITLNNLQVLIDLISRMQGFRAFNPIFFGETLPNEVSLEVLVVVMTVTAVISLIAGVVPAIKACLLRPAAILRSE